VTTVCWSLVETTARLLEGERREAVLGDLVESGETAWQAVLGILGLVVRLEVSLWKSWRPWLAAFGVSFPASFFLMEISVSVSYAFLHWPGISSLLPKALLLIACSLAAGYLVAALSRRTLWMSAVLCCAPCLFCWARFRVPSLSRFSLLLFLLPAAWGARQALRRART
jgi:hypothetical protein